MRKMEKWKNGKMEKWKNHEYKYAKKVLFTKAR